VTASGNKLEKIILGLIISAFHPKALNVFNATGRSSGLLPAEHLPVRCGVQWFEDPAVVNRIKKSDSRFAAYSYGDSAGLSPASLFIPTIIAGKPITAANVDRKVLF
jgi:hypothetical protein